ncbi:MAG: hypothetical protein AAF583_11185 [Pseudomonadota bacterium]
MAENVDTLPRVRVIGDRIRIIWTDYGEDGMSITTTGEQHALSLYAATALVSLLKDAVIEAHDRNAADVAPLPRKAG